MSKNSKLRSVANKSASDSSGAKVTSKLEVVVLGLEKSSETESPYVSLKYYTPEHECFSCWSADELKAFSQFCKKIRENKWSGIYRSAGKAGNKTGFGYTVHKDRGKLPRHPELDNLSEDLNWFELRVNQRVRVHGFRAADAFFLVFLDREHAIYSM